MSTLIERLQEIMESQEPPWEHADLVRESGQSSSVVSQWLGKGSKTIHTIGKITAAAALERATGYSAEWIATGKGPKFAMRLSVVPSVHSTGEEVTYAGYGKPDHWGSEQHSAKGVRGAPPVPGSPLAQLVSHPEQTIDPPEVTWESILSLRLPTRFKLLLRDDAMALDDPPSMGVGTYVILKPVTEAKPGQVVLIADADDNLYLRKYQERRPGHWSAVARNPAYQLLDSREDGLRLIALQIGYISE